MNKSVGSWLLLFFSEKFWFTKYINSSDLQIIVACQSYKYNIINTLHWSVIILVKMPKIYLFAEILYKWICKFSQRIGWEIQMYHSAVYFCIYQEIIADG